MEAWSCARQDVALWRVQLKSLSAEALKTQNELERERKKSMGMADRRLFRADLGVRLDQLLDRERVPKFIQSVVDEGVVVTDPEVVKSVTRDFFYQWTARRPAGKWGTPDWVTELLRPREDIDPEWFGGLLGPITAEEFQSFIHPYKLNPAPGPSGISVAHIRFAPEFVQHSVLEAVNAIFKAACEDEGELEEWMKLATILPIPKGSMEEMDVTKSRPISLLEFSYKLMDGVVWGRVQAVMERMFLLSPNNHAFRSEFSASLPLWFLTVVGEHASKENPVFFASLDAAKAYDSVSEEFLGRLWEHYKFPPGLVQFAHAMRKGAASQVVTGYGLSDRFPIERGLRQGAPGSPFVWLLVLQPFLEFLVTDEQFQESKVDVLGV